MTIYRVGQAGATVYSAEGRAIVRLAPGSVVVPGTIDEARTSAERAGVLEARRRSGYDDKQLRPAEDKAE